MSAPRLLASGAALASGGASVVLAGTRSGTGVAVLVLAGVLLGAIGSRWVPALFVLGAALVVADLAMALLRHDIGPWRALAGTAASYGYAELSWLAAGRQRRGRPRDLDPNLAYLAHGGAALALGCALGTIVIASRGALEVIPASLGRAAGGLAAALLVAVVVWRRRGASDEAPSQAGRPAPLRDPHGG